jgi:serine/threonine protein kinase
MRTSNHLSRDELSAYVLGRLPWEHLADVERHLAACDECECQVDSLNRSSDSFIALLRGLQVGDGLRPVPKCVAGLEIIKELAHGGLGFVYLAHHPGLDRRQAVKLLLPEHRGNGDLVARFQREKRAIAQIKDKLHIVEIFDAGCDASEGPYLVMEYLDGASLKQLVSRHGPLPPAEACELVRQAALGLQATHEQGLVHRDVKPSNLILARFSADKAALKVIDYGLVKEVGGPSAAAPEATSAGVAIGTPDYMAPEQAGIWSNLPVGPAADVYSLGCTLYTLLHGQPPFCDRPTVEKHKGHATAAYPRLNRSDLSAEVVSLLTAMLDKNPHLRPAAREVAQRLSQFGCDMVQLRALLGASASEATVPPSASRGGASPRPPRRSRRWLTVAGVGVAFLLAGFVVYKQISGDIPTVPREAGKGQVAALPSDSAPEGPVQEDGSNKSVKGGAYHVDDLKVATLNLPARALLPCMLWADVEGSAFLALEGDAGVLRRISFPDFTVTKQKNLDRKFAWMALSAEGLVLSDSDSGKLWVVDPATLEVKTKIPVPKLKRATSAPGLSWAVACDKGPHNSQMLYVVDLVKKTVDPWAVPQALRTTIGLENPAMTPNGAYVFTHGNLQGGDRMTMSRFSFKDGNLMYEAEGPRVDMRFNMAGNTADNTAGITFSSDSKSVCMVAPWGNIRDRRSTTAIYPVETFDRYQCTLDHADGMQRGPQGEPPLAVGFDVKADCIYTQNNDRKLMVCTLHGITKKAYIFDHGANKPVVQFLVYPGGSQAVLLTRAAVYWIELPGKANSSRTIIEEPREK